MKKIRLYLAGPLFGIADRHHNLLLARALRELGYVVLLPQKEALKFYDGHSFDLRGIAENCREQLTRSDYVIANVDGPDVDSGTATEVGIALSTTKALNRSKPSVFCVRTDFRTYREKEIGINAMLELADKVIYKPAFVDSLDDVTNFYADLAKEIDMLVTEEQNVSGER